MELLYTEKDGNVKKYTEEMLKNVIEDKIYYENKYYTYSTNINNIKAKVYQFFKNHFNINETEIIYTIDNINELLESIDTDKLPTLFTVNGTISFTVKDIEASSEKEANDIVNDNLTIDYSDENLLEEWNIKINNTTQQ